MAGLQSRLTNAFHTQRLTADRLRHHKPQIRWFSLHFIGVDSAR